MDEKYAHRQPQLQQYQPASFVQADYSQFSIPPLSGAGEIALSNKSSEMAPSSSVAKKGVSFPQYQLPKASKTVSQSQGGRYQNLPPVEVSLPNQSQLPSQTKQNTSIISQSVKTIKPQISKEYASTLILGRPDLTILENEFERGEKFYEHQYSMTKLTGGDDNGAAAEIRFRECESQIRSEASMMGEALKHEAMQYYESFL
ncbi:hypothetical protein FGO68_gene11510 [Halteria grandinella]|uniref:Uncharacterized protein n=1 Tax=Halteria grandinella TaxID=5974 RepID=A0A8J8NBS8_HALGN|nr:hypothetical protein FGO68_gene11510 [Halteria grandinella]